MQYLDEIISEMKQRNTFSGFKENFSKKPVYDRYRAEQPQNQQYEESWKKLDTLYNLIFDLYQDHNISYEDIIKVVDDAHWQAELES